MAERGPYKMDEETVEAFCQAIALGSTITLACEYASIDLKTYERWKHRAEADAADEGYNPDDPGVYVGFMDKVVQARAKHGIRHLARIEKASKRVSNWRASLEAYKLAHVPDVRRHEHTGSVGVGLTWLDIAESATGKPEKEDS